MLKRFLLASALMVSGLALAAGTAPAAMISGHPVSPLRTPDGRVVRGSHDQMYSSNWSGYALTQYATGQQYTSAAGTWTVPTVAKAKLAGYSSSWVGIGGDCLNATCSSVDNTLIQLGTEQDANRFGATYYAWYEMLPAAETKITTLAVRPGDVINASLQVTSVSGSSQTWLLTLLDKTTGRSWSHSFAYASSLASAEWIEEAPYSGSILPLADFRTATFDPGTVNGGQNPGLAEPDAIIMYDPHGQTSNVSSPDIDTDGFNACWGNHKTLTACSTPNS